MSVILAQDELRVGMYITVFKGKFTEKEISTFGQVKVVVEENLISFKGRVLKIVVIDSPYIVVEYYLSRCEDDPIKLSLDTRDIKLKECSNDYVKVYEPRFKVVKKEVVDWEFEQEK